MFLDPLRLWLLLVIINIAVGATAWIEIVLSLLIAAAMVTATTTSTVELIVPTASLTTHTTMVMPTTLIAISLVVVVGVELILLRPELLRLLGHVPSLSAADLAALWIEALDVVVVQLIALLRIK